MIALGEVVPVPTKPSETDDNVHRARSRGNGDGTIEQTASEAQLNSVLSIVPDAIIIIDAVGTIASFSPAAERLFGYSAMEVIGRNVKLLMPAPYRDEHDGYLAHHRTTGEKKIIGIGRDVEAQRKDGSIFPIHLAVNDMVVDGRRMFTGLVHDLSELRQRDAVLRQSQKMETVGQLTGGIAHDFNNLLTVVIGNNELLAARLDNDERARKLLTASTAAALRGAQLTSQLLSFARQMPLDPRVMDLNELVLGMQDMLQRTLGETIEISTKLEPDLGKTLADPTQVHNAVLNLAINARDAMPDGGALTIETANVDLDVESAMARADAEAGQYVRLSVNDTGTGIPPKVLARVFEPFFTTKEKGKGTGLGLSMVHGFAKQSGGHLDIYSEVGHGTAINLYLPDAKETEVESLLDEATSLIKEGGGELVLVVEDDSGVRDVTVARLEHLGYRIIEAANGQAALDILAAEPVIDLILTDMVMPGGMTGSDLIAEVREKYPEMKVVFTSGYAEGGQLPTVGAPWLRKPYNLDELARTLRQLLDD